MAKNASSGNPLAEGMDIRSIVQYLSKNYVLPLFLACAVILTVVVFSQPPTIRGDGNEYLQMLQSFADHGTPELTGQDINEVNLIRLLDDAGLHPAPYGGYYKSFSGKQYSYHFWLYPLMALPAKLALKIIGGDELRAFQITNLLLMLLSLAAILFRSSFSAQRKSIFAALVLLSPAVWYLSWPSPEVFSFSLVIMAIAYFSRERYVGAVLLSGLAATQNPPLLVLMLFFLAVAVWRMVQKKEYSKVLAIGASALPAFVPQLFYFVNFGTPNLIYKVGAASLKAVSFHKAFSFLFDLNMGLLPFIPLVLVLFVYLLFRKREKTVYLLLFAMAAMLFLATSTENWNSDSTGLMRYAVWFLPIIFWGIAEGYNGTRGDKIFLGIALASQYFIATMFPSYSPKYTENNSLAEYVLASFPSAYSPVPEVFAERIMGKEASFADRLPILYRREDGVVTKVLSDNAGLKRLRDFVDVDAAFLAEQTKRHDDDTGLFYIDAANGEMRVDAQDSTLKACKSKITLANQAAITKTATEYVVMLAVTNKGNEPWYAEGAFPISAAYHIFDSSNNIASSGSLRIIHRIPPGRTDTVPIRFTTPPMPGVYYIEFDLFQEDGGWFKDHGNKPLTVRIVIE